MSDLISLSEYKDYEGIIDSTNDDLKIAMLIKSVSRLVKNYCASSIVDYYNNDKIELISVSIPSVRVFLTESPLISVTQVEVKTTNTEPYYVLDPSLYSADFLIDALVRHDSSGSPRPWEEGINSVKVSYRAGYESCPEDLKLAVIDLVNYYKLDEHKTRQSVLSANKENYVVTKDFPEHIKRVLDLYKVHV